MNSVDKITLVYASICFTLLLTAIPHTAMAQDITLLPSIEVAGEYDDNVYYTRKFTESDCFGRISPEFKLDYTTELIDLETRVAFDILRYLDETDLDRENQYYEIEGKYQFMEKLSVSGHGSYIKDTTLESEIEESGLADNPRQDRRRYIGGMGFLYKLSEVWDAGFNYNYTNTHYEWERNVDYDVNSISFSFNHNLDNQLDIFTIQPYYTNMDSEASEVNNYGLSFGWLHPFSETLNLTATLGARYTKSDYSYVYNVFDPVTGIPIPTPVDEEESNWAGVASIDLEKTGEIYSAAIGYNQDLGYSSYGEPLQRYKIFLNADRKITKRFRVKFTGNLYFTKSEGDVNDRDDRYYNLTPSLNYKITENYSLRLAYSFSEYYQKELENNRDKDRNRVWLALRFKFPKKW